MTKGQRIGAAVLTHMLLSLWLTPDANAQFVDLVLEVEPELTAEVEQPLNFGMVPINTGRNVIALGDYNMGVFGITALQNQQVMISLQMPSELKSEDPDISDIVPLDLRARYGFNRNSVQNSYIIPEGLTSLTVQSEDPHAAWARLFIYIFGTIEVGDVAEGLYSEDILLYVEYI